MQIGTGQRDFCLARLHCCWGPSDSLLRWIISFKGEFAAFGSWGSRDPSSFHRSLPVLTIDPCGATRCELASIAVTVFECGWTPIV